MSSQIVMDAIQLQNSISNLRNELKKGRSKIRQLEASRKELESTLTKTPLIYLSKEFRESYALNQFVTDIIELYEMEASWNSDEKKQNSDNGKSIKVDYLLMLINILIKLDGASLLDEVRTEAFNFSIHSLSKSYLHEHFKHVVAKISDILHKVVTEKTMLYENEKSLSNFVVVLKRRMDTSDSTVLANFAKATTTFIRHLRWSSVSNMYKNIVKWAVETASRFIQKTSSLPRHTLNVLYELLVTISDEYGIEFRNQLLEILYSHGMTLASKLNVDIDVECPKVIWNLMDRFIHLAAPDCQSEFVIDKHSFFPIVSTALSSIERSLFAISFNRPTFVLINDKDVLSLIARMLVLSEYSPLTQPSFIQISQEKEKTTKHKMDPPPVTFFKTLCTWDLAGSMHGRNRPGVINTDYPNLYQSIISILHSLFNRWAFRMPVELRRCTISSIWRNRIKIDNDNLREGYCNLLTAINEHSGFDKADDAGVWKFAISMTLFDSSYESAMRLMISMLRFRRKELALSDKEVSNSICTALARSKTVNKAWTSLLGYLISKCSFDEKAVYSKSFDKDTGLPQWRFRSQLISWILTYLTNNCSMILYQLCLYHPNYQDIEDDPKMDMSQLERSLCLLNASTVRNPSKNDIDPCTVYSDNMEAIVIEELRLYVLNTVKNERLRRSTDTYYQIPYLLTFRDFAVSCSYVLADSNDALLEYIESMKGAFIYQIVTYGDEAIKDEQKINVEVNPDRRRDTVVLRTFCLDNTVSSNDMESCISKFEELIRAGMLLKSKVSSIIDDIIEKMKDMPDDAIQILIWWKKYGYLMEDKTKYRLQGIIETLCENMMLQNQEENANKTYKILAHLMCSSYGADTIDMNHVLNVIDPDYISFSIAAFAISPEVLWNRLSRDDIMGQPLFIQNILSHIFTNPHYEILQLKLLEAITSNEELYKVCELYLPNLPVHLHFHSFSLLDNKLCLEDFAESARKILEKAFNDLNRDRKWLLKPATSTYRDQIFRCKESYWEERGIVDEFWKSYALFPHQVLTQLRFEVDSHLSVNCLPRLLRFIAVLIEKLPLCFPVKRQRPFFNIIEAMLVDILYSIKRRYSSRHALKIHLELISPILDSLPDDVYRTELLVRIADVMNNAEDELVGMFPWVKEKAERWEAYVIDAVNKFIKGDLDSITVCTLLSEMFWKLLLVRMEDSNANTDMSIADKKILRNAQFDRIMFFMHICPHLREYIVPVLIYFIDCSKPFNYTRSTPIQRYRNDDIAKDDLSMRINDSNKEQINRLLFDYAQCIVFSPSVTSRSVFECALSILSCDIFGDTDTILEQPTVESLKNHILLSWNPPETNNLISNFCFDLLEKAYRESVRIGDNCWHLHIISRYIKSDLVLASLLAPMLCAIKDVETVVSSFLTKLVQNLGHKDDKTDQYIASRVICECIDAIGLANINLPAETLQQIAEIVLKKKLPLHAYAVANLCFDKYLGENRSLTLFTPDWLNENDKLLYLLRDIHLMSEDADALSSLPAKYLHDDHVRLLFWRRDGDWMRVLSSPVAKDLQIVDASWFSGISLPSASDEGIYLNAWRTGQWKKVGYPSRINSFQHAIYAALYLYGVNRKYSNKLIEHIKKRYFAMLSESDSLDMSKCLELITFMNVNQPFSVTYHKSSSLNDLCIEMARKGRRFTGSMDKNDASIYTNTVRDAANDLASTISELINILCKMKAFEACVSILNHCISYLPTETQNVLKLKKCLIDKVRGDDKQAEFTLQTLLGLDSSSSLPMTSLTPKTRLTAYCLLAEIFEERSQLDEAVKILKEADALTSQNTVADEICQRLRIVFHRVISRQLSQLEAYMVSPLYTMKKDAVDDWEKKLTQSINIDERNLLEHELKCEQDAITHTEERLQNLTIEAVRSGFGALKALEPCNSTAETNRVLFPLLDIIFRSNQKFASKVTNEVRQYASKMSCRIWLPAVDHIIQHCFLDDNSGLPIVIQHMITQMIVAYPFHVLNSVLFHVQEASKEKLFILNTMMSNASKICGDPKTFTEIVADMRKAHRIYINFAITKVTDEKSFRPEKDKLTGNTIYKLTKDNILKKQLEFLKKIPLPMVEQELREERDYTREYLIKWDHCADICILADGISTPKIIKVLGSNNISYKTIWKCEDLRQDCLVEQLFSVMNDLLMSDSKISSRPLRTYKVIPLNNKCGIIEFCENTKSLKEILVGADRKSGLHKKFRWHDMPPVEAMLQLKDESAGKKLETFERICSRIHPVFRYFLYEESITVSKWTENINRYRRSLAEWSIVCYIIGLGDRHTSNVLFEPETCRFVHIDLGMILEHSSRRLPIPERVPFRLTRDLMDPILIEGIKGGRLEKLAISTMNTMRKNKEVILGVVSVLLRERMSNFTEVGNKDGPSFVATAAVGRLREKLEGTIAGSTPQTTQSQTCQLLSQAIDLHNLSSIFCGWMAFL